MRLTNISKIDRSALLEAKRRRARTIIDGMIKTLIAKGRTRDEAIADLKKQIDSRFYEHMDAAVGSTVTEDARLTPGDSVETWIRRFKDSRHPKFAGKSPEQREKMARAAHYRAVQDKPFTASGQRTTRESDELDELRIDNKDGWGAVPYNQNVDYRGLRVRVRPSTFLKLAHKLDRYYSADDIERHIRADGAIGAPFLMVAIPQDWFEGDMSSPAEIYGHEGRNRMAAALRAEGDEPVETHLFFGSGLRNRDLKPEIVARLNDDVISQDGKLVGGPWFTQAAASKQTNEVAKVRISKDPDDLGAYVDDEGDPEPTVMLPIALITGVLEPDDMHQTKPGAPQKIARMAKAIKSGKHMPPILVRRHSDGYQVMDGHHRFKAYRLAKSDEIPARIVDPENITGDVDEAWSNRYKKSINCSNPKGFSQRAHCAARKKRAAGGKTKSKPVRESFNPIRYADQARKAIEIGWIDNVIERMIKAVAIGKLAPADPITELLEENRRKIIRHILISIRDRHIGHAREAIGMLRKLGIEWKELSDIEMSLEADLNENFADGKGPGRPGDSQRHGIPKGATMAQLRKAAKAPGRKGQLARWQINMRNGRKKANEAIAPHGGPEDELRMMKAGTKPAALVMDYHFDTLYRPISDEMGWEVVPFRVGDHTHYAVAQHGDRPRAERIAGMVAAANKGFKRGERASPEYHRELGTLLGYSHDDIEHFLGNQKARETVGEADGQARDAALTVFDMDETLFHTKAKIGVVRDGKVVRRLSNQEYNTYQLQPGEQYDYSEFRDARLFHDTSVPIERMWRKAQNLLSNIGKRPNSRVIIVTARSDLDDRETFLSTFRKHGLDIDKVHVHRAGNLPVPAAAAKKAIIATYLNTGRFDSARLIDDAESNLRSFLELRDDYPDIRFSAYLVLPGGNMVKYES